MLPSPTIVLVDNQKSELDELSAAFFDSGIPCLPLLYTSRHGVAQYKISNSNSIRWLFLDLNLEECSSLDASTLVGPIKRVISELISDGFYYLVFWSKHVDVVDALIDRITSDVSLSSTLCAPIAYACLDKLVLRDNPMELKKELKRIMSDDKLLESTLTWENAVKNSASLVLQKLNSLSQSNNKWDMNSKKNDITNLLSLLAYEANGIKAAAESPQNSINKGLFSLVEDNYFKSSKELEWDEFLLTKYNKIKIENTIKEKLNTFLLLDDSEIRELREKEHYDKGMISLINTTGDCFKQLFGETSFEKIIREEFIPTNSKTLDLTEVKLGLLEISPDCDHANKKIKMYRFVLSAIIPTEVLKNAGDLKHHTGILALPNTLLSEKTVKILFSHKFIVSLPIATVRSEIFTSQGLRLKESILTTIRVSMSQFISRPGYMAIH